MITYSYYPGCTLKNKAQALDRYARAAFSALGIELQELPQWQCCGAVYPQASDEIATRLSAIRALVAARDLGQPLLTLCSACHHVIKRANEDIKTDADFRDKVNRYLQLDTPYAGETRVVHCLEALRDDVGFAALKEKAAFPLKGQKIGAYYGCLLLRPSAQMAFDDPEDPSLMEDFIRAIGADCVIYPYRNECCGGYIVLEDRAQAQTQVEKILSSAAAAGAETLVTACPLCMYNLTKNATAHRVRTVYFTELLAEALGVKEG